MTPATAIKEFVITRVFEAPRDVVWKAWTDPAQMQQWFGPKGVATTTSYKMDLRPGGMSHYSMRTPDGTVMWGKAVYREIIAPEKLVWVNSFSDEKGGTTRHPLSSEWPLEMLTTVTFGEVGDKTRITVRWIPVNASDEEIQFFNKSHASMTGGWTGTFEQLDEYLSKG